MSDTPSIAIVGASGAVGQEAIRILLERGYAPDRIRLFGARSAGASLAIDGHAWVVRESAVEVIAESAFVILCTDAQVSGRLGPQLVTAGATVVDCSSEFRQDPAVPLVIPEINGRLLHEPGRARLIASPNCSTTMLLLALEPIRRTFGVRSIIVSTYQAVSGAGLAALDELRRESERALRDEAPEPRTFPVTCGFNVFPHESALDPESGFCGEEVKMITESRRIWDDPALGVLPTCVRVPVRRVHAQAIVVTTNEATSVAGLIAALEGGAGIALAQEGEVLHPRRVEGGDLVHLARVREDPGSGGTRFALWACCDQLRKGAALNAVQIIEGLRRPTPDAKEAAAGGASPFARVRGASPHTPALTAARVCAGDL